MTFKILKSQAPSDLAEQVEGYISALNAHRRTVGVPAPSAPDVVAACVTRKQYPIKVRKPDDFIADFEIVNDDPPPLTLEQKKQKLTEELMQVEREASDAILPMRRRRMQQIKMAAAAKSKKAVDKAFLKDCEKCHGRLDKLHHTVAEALNEIEDLTAKTVDKWKLPKLR